MYLIKIYLMYDNILRLQISVNYVLRVQIRYSVADLIHDN
jgi:hypothetical protein